MQHPYISLIVPVYNAEKLLVRCIDSILSSEYTDFELILVDDGSKDNSGLICDSYASRNAKIRVFHQENQGVSVARNLGIEMAQGNWIAFVDADDKVTPRYLWDMVAALDDDFSGLIIQGVEMNTNGRCDTLFLPPGKYHEKEFGNLFQDGRILSLGFPFSKLYKRSVIVEHNIWFDTEIHMCEDLVFMLQYLNYVQEIRVLPVCNYQYYLGSNSASLKYYTFDSELHCYHQIKEKLQKLCIKFDFVFSASLKKMMGISLFRSVLALYMQSRYPFHERMRKLREYLEQESPDVKEFYFPALIQLKIAKKLLFASLFLFDVYMRCLLYKHR